MDECVFCKIINNKINTKKLYEDEQIIVINDINPVCKYHYLCIPKKHFKLIKELNINDISIIQYCFTKILSLEQTLKIQDGYRIIINQGDNANQTVPHLHIHILGGEKLKD